MSTRQTIKYADDFHLYTDLLDRETGDKRPVYLSLNCEFAAYVEDGHCGVTVKLTEDVARKLGLLGGGDENRADRR